MLKVSIAIESSAWWIHFFSHVGIVQGKDINKANFDWTCHVCVWLSHYQYGLAWLNSKSYQNNSMHWIQLVDHWLWPSLFQSNLWWLCPMVQSALLVCVGDHDYGLLIYIFSNLCTSLHQSDTKAWDNNDIGSTSHVTFFPPGCPITWWNHLTVWTTIDLDNAIFQLGWARSFL